MLYQYIPRVISDRLIDLTKNFACIVITGARQVGKSTLLKHLFPNFQYVMFDPVVDVENARQDPELFFNNHKTPLILDEIQYAPEIVSVLKRIIDKNKKPGSFILTGSQQWGVIKKIAESLTGRAVFLDLESFSLAEVANIPTNANWLEKWLNNQHEFFKSSSLQRIMLSYNLYELLWRGTLPESIFLPKNLIPTFQLAYQKTYIERDVTMLADVSDVQLFRRFVRLLSAYSAQEINYSQLGRELNISPKTAKRWIDLLIETFQWVEFPSFSKNVIKRVSLKPKGYFTDTGQICFSQSISSPEAIAAHPLFGALFESAVVSEIRKRCSWMISQPNIYHFRTFSGAEVDLILEKDGIYFPIEIKAKSRPTKKDVLGITAFRKIFNNLNIAKGLVIAPSDSIYPITENDWVIPWDLE